MYFMAQGCSSLLHLMVKHPVLVLSLGLAGFAASVGSNPGPGDRFGTSGYLTGMENKYLKDNPQVSSRLKEVSAHFETMHLEASENELRRLLEYSDPCTAADPADLIGSPNLFHQATFLLYLDEYGRGGPQKAKELFLPPRAQARKELRR